jgi:hypothetical protein
MADLEAPYIGIAALCQDIVTTPGGGTSLVGIIEGLQVSLPYIGRVKAVAVVHSGSSMGLFGVSATVKDSAGRHVSDSIEEMIRFNQKDSSHYLFGEFELRIGDAGLHFFEVYLEGRLSMRVPIHIHEAR